ncbi:hypothetical protein HYS42_01355 [Candidatus Saccharibacteria bacterium]|nr:hypothetical protein [Candidatus Saccharibacteria bacterium]
MDMQEANIGIFDDLEIFRRIAGRTLNILGHRVLIDAGTVPESLAAIEALGVSLDVALVDGNLDSRSENMGDGKEIARALRKRFGDEVIIVSISGNGLFEGADLAIAKQDTKAISDFIDGLPTRAS